VSVPGFRETVTRVNYSLIIKQCQTNLRSNKPLYDTLQTVRHSTNKHAILRITAITRRSGHCPGLLPETNEGLGSDERGNVVQPSTRRGDDQRPGWRTHAPANGRSAVPHDPARTAASAVSMPPDGFTSAPRLTHDNVGELVSARRTCFSSPS